MPKKDYGVTPEEFIRAWAASETVGEVAQKTGMPVDIIHARACSYRRAGVNLRKLRRQVKKRLDVDALNRLIAQIEHEQKTPKGRSAGRASPESRVGEKR